MGNKLIVTAAPHITSADSTQKIMQRVCIRLACRPRWLVIIVRITPDHHRRYRGRLCDL